MATESERGLLILAAKAAGRSDDAHAWNPLVCSQQAFDLAVQLRFRIDHVYHYRQQVMVGNGECWAVIPYNGDSAAATRRAVVEAAKLGSLKLQMELRKGRAAQVPDNDGC